MFEGAVRWPHRPALRPVGMDVIAEIRGAMVEARMEGREPYAVLIPEATKEELRRVAPLADPTVCGLELVPISVLPEYAHFAVLSR